MPPFLRQNPVFHIQIIKFLFGVFAQGIEPLFRVLSWAVEFLFDRYLLLNNFSEVFLYKEKLMRDIRGPGLVFVPVLRQAISLESIYFPGLFKMELPTVLVTPQAPDCF
ncbi:hypothetical protein PENFLA_c041G03757 [Penicillium flavigenum]|uniref:Uncharacterized protein n=1 Tax=Penicillium flavigenum TaxID=254877 RepID=A0A1V6SK39_9EURO|nr:hypothetical protein PENFLA_c041G03757 [Penicillium flavigenum]